MLEADRSDPYAEAQRSFAHRGYNRVIRPAALWAFGRQLASFRGIPVRYQAVTDRTRYIDYKPSMCRFIEQHVTDGDTVVDIAAGWGVFATLAARQGATVTTYEGAANMVEWARDTFRLNNVSDRIEIVEGTVEQAYESYGSRRNDQAILAGELPAADVLILDCEGAERAILSEPSLTETFDTAIIETHPEQDAATDRVRSILDRHGWRVVEQHRMDRDGKHAILARPGG